VRIPRRLLEKAKLRPGDRVDVEEVPGGVLLHGEAPPGLAWEGALLVVDGEPSDDFAAEMNRLKKEDLARELRNCRPR
jgi:antitoxin component of MazEF toxin-antitoxin module